MREFEKGPHGNLDREGAKFVEALVCSKDSGRRKRWNVLEGGGGGDRVDEGEGQRKEKRVGVQLEKLERNSD